MFVKWHVQISSLHYFMLLWVFKDVQQMWRREKVITPAEAERSVVWIHKVRKSRKHTANSVQAIGVSGTNLSILLNNPVNPLEIIKFSN